MFRLNIMQYFMSMIPFLKEEYHLPKDDWLVLDLLGDMFSNPGTSQTWKYIIEELGKKTEFQQYISHENIIINESQAYMAMRCFLDKNYWEKDHNTTLDYVVLDMNNHINGTIPLEKTEMWSVWVECVQKNLKYESLLDKG